MDVLIAEVQASAGLCRSYLGPCKTIKCVIEDHRGIINTDGSNTLATNAYDLLHAIDGNPTSTTWLLELIDAQQESSSSGTSWLLTLLSLVLGVATQLQRQGAPLTVILAGLEEGLQLCEQVAHESSIPVTDLAASLSHEQLALEWHQITSCLNAGSHQQPVSDVAGKTIRTSREMTEHKEFGSQHNTRPEAQQQTYQPQSNHRLNMASHSLAIGVEVSNRNTQPETVIVDDLAWFFNDADDELEPGPPATLQHKADQLSIKGMDLKPFLPADAERPANLLSLQQRESQTAATALHEQVMCVKTVHEQPESGGRSPQEVLSALALTLSHGADSDMQMAAAALATSVGLLPEHATSELLQLQQPLQHASGFEELKEFCAAVSWDHDIHIHDVLGPAAGHSCVREGVLLPVIGKQMQHIVQCQLAPSILAVRSQAAASAPASITSNASACGAGSNGSIKSESSAEADRGCEPGVLTGQPMLAAFLEGGLGVLPPNHPSSVAAGTLPVQSPTIRLPAWSKYEHTACSSQVTQIISSAREMTNHDIELEQAVREIAAALQPIRAQLVIMVNALSEQLCSAVYEQTGIIILPGVPFKVLNALARDCGVVPVAGLAGLLTAKQHQNVDRPVDQHGMQSLAQLCNHNSEMGLAYVKVSIIEKGIAPDEGRQRNPRHVATHATLQQLLLLQACFSKKHQDVSLVPKLMPQTMGPQSEYCCCMPRLYSTPLCNDKSLHSSLCSCNCQTLGFGRVENRLPRAVTVFLSAPLPVMLQQQTHRLRSCFGRLLSCIQQGVMLPGAGLFELLCMHALNTAAIDLETLLAKGSNTVSMQHTHDQQQPAWKLFNAVAKDDTIIWKVRVFEALSQCMHDMVLVLLQNQGHSFAHASSYTSAAAALLPTYKGRGIGTTGCCLPYTLGMDVLQSAQSVLLQTSDDTCSTVFVVDDKACRLQAIRSVGACMIQMLSTDRYIINQAGTHQ